MPEASTLALFCAASLAMLVIPGPAVLYIVTRSVDQGRAAGVVSMLGIATGTLFHIAAAALGLSALLLSSSVAFATLKYAGAAYLVFLGLQKIFGIGSDGEIRDEAGRSLKKAYLQGIVVNVLNPKTALFFFAFFPQFVDPTVGPVALQIVVLGLVFEVLAILSDGSYAVVSASIASRLRRARRGNRGRYVTGGIYVALGAAAAVAGPAET